MLLMCVCVSRIYIRKKKIDKYRLTEVRVAGLPPLQIFKERKISQAGLYLCGAASNTFHQYMVIQEISSEIWIPKWEVIW